MILNPVVVGKGGSSEPRWQKLQINGEQDVPATRVSSWLEGNFAITFESLPKAVVFRAPAIGSGGAFEYSLVAKTVNSDRWYIASDSSSGTSCILTVQVSGTTISGTIRYGDWEAISTEFLPIYE